MAPAKKPGAKPADTNDPTHPGWVLLAELVDALADPPDDEAELDGYVHGLATAYRHRLPTG